MRKMGREEEGWGDGGGEGGRGGEGREKRKEEKIDDCQCKVENTLCVCVILTTAEYY